MNIRSSRERELRELVIAANSGEATDEQFARLDELIRTDRQCANYAARLLEQQAALAWQGSMRADSTELESSAILNAGLQAQAADDRVRRSRDAISRKYFRSWPAIAVCIGFFLGGLTAALIYSNIVSNRSRAQIAAGTPAGGEQPYEAHLIRSTACLWDRSSVGSREIGSGLTSGESLHLLEGLAEFNLVWGASGRATLSLEGPAAMVLTTDGMPTLRFGRLSARINTSLRPFVVETPVGRVSLADYGSIGVSAFGNEGEIHVFDGAATFEPAWRSPEQTTPIKIEAGQSIHIQTGNNGEPKITRHAADPEYFAAQMSMSSDGLTIPAAYVAAVKKSLPIGYWRFERDDWPIVPNVMGPRLTCHVDGSLGRAIFHGNQAAEFGVTDQGGEIVSNDVLDDLIRDSYSIEFWVKPSHYHVGALVSLVGDTPTPSGILPHGMLVELGGTGKIPTATHHPGCVRFLHRSPASNESQTGTSCYSETSYTLRKWQHIVAVKDGPKMRLYINDELAASGEDPSALTPGLRIVVGKLYPSRGTRKFIGQLDELAIYNRALTPEEIANHYHLVRPKVASHTPSI